MPPRPLKTACKSSKRVPKVLYSNSIASPDASVDVKEKGQNAAVVLNPRENTAAFAVLSDQPNAVEKISNSNAEEAAAPPGAVASPVFDHDKQTLISSMNLTGKGEFQATFPFKKVELVKGARWYVKFYVWDVQKNKLARKRYDVPAKYETEDEKKAYYKSYKKQVDKLLEEGFHIDRSKTKKQEQAVKEEKKKAETSKELLTINLARDKFTAWRRQKKKSIRGDRAYENAVNQFGRWLFSEYQLSPRLTWIGGITEDHAKEYSEHLLDELEYEPKSHNNNITFLVTWFNRCKEEKWITEEENPFKRIETLKEDYGTKNIPFSDSQLENIKKYLADNDPYLLLIGNFIYYTCIRPIELRRLRVKNVDMEQKKITVPGPDSKTDRGVLPINEALYELLLKMELHKYDPEDFLFSGEQHPSSVKMGENWMQKHFKKVKDRFKLTEDHTLYGFKHTAVCRWYRATKDLYAIMRLCRHTTIQMTIRYLKSMGVLQEEEINTMPKM